jgi:hypothetical protein
VFLLFLVSALFLNVVPFPLNNGQGNPGEHASDGQIDKKGRDERRFFLEVSTPFCFV